MKMNKPSLYSYTTLALLLAAFLLVAFQGCSSERPASLNEAVTASAACATDSQLQPENDVKLSLSDMIPRITIQELKRKVDSNAAVVIVDNRSQAEYDLDHIKGAICVPLTTIVTGEWILPIDRELVFYCA